MKSILYFFILGALFNKAYAQSARVSTFEMVLKEGWEMQSSLKDSSSGSVVSAASFNPSHWYHVHLPATIIGGLLENKEFDFDPFYGKNFEKLNQERFDHPWWFRKTFQLPADQRGKTVVLKLHGINYKANVWLNGMLIGDSSTVKGPFRIIDLDITKSVSYTGPNTLAIEIQRPFNPQRAGGDLAIDYADWVHYPPDYNGGIVNDVEIRTYDKVGVEYPLVTTKFDLPSLSVAHLNVYAIVTNFSENEEEAIVEGAIDQKIRFSKKVKLSPREKRQVSFLPSDFPQLNIKNPLIWWPWQYGKQNFHRIDLRLVHDNHVSNSVRDKFGIREVSSALIDTTSRVFLINGKRIMLRGAAWSPDIFQRRSKKRQEQEIRLVKDMNMNIIRSEGKLEDDNFYDLCDKNGLLVMSGWMCCGAWQYPELWDSSKRKVAMGSDSSVMLWLRNKPCMLVWLNGSDMPPRDTSVERDWLTIENNLKWPNPVIATATGRRSVISGYSGVKMNGPYEWVPPIYWETDTSRYGGAWSFATEISPGPSIPPFESLTRFMNEDSLVGTSSQWLYHAGTGPYFASTHIFDSALQVRYGPSSNAREYAAKAQAQDYAGHRAMMEAYGLKKYHKATGVIQWMLSNPWPGLIWHTYDYYLNPTGTYYGIKKGLEPLHVMYSYKSRSVYIVNSYLHSFKDLTASAEVYSGKSDLLYKKQVQASVSGDSTAKCFLVPDQPGSTEISFLRLQLTNKTKTLNDINWYWLSPKKEDLKWSASKWYYTPESEFADFSALSRLPATPLHVNYVINSGQDSTKLQISVANPGASVSFFIHLRLLNNKGGEDILPVLFSDNYFELAPKEQRVITCSFANRDKAVAAKPYLQVSSWNIDTSKSKINNNGGFISELPTESSSRIN